jgi:ABC-type sugar transport system ATPase subunit
MADVPQPRRRPGGATPTPETAGRAIADLQQEVAALKRALAPTEGEETRAITVLTEPRKAAGAAVELRQLELTVRGGRIVGVGGEEPAGRLAITQAGTTTIIEQEGDTNITTTTINCIGFVP